ncbi:unnamed protein product, partial [Phaeothamnion confervicola]
MNPGDEPEKDPELTQPAEEGRAIEAGEASEGEPPDPSEEGSVAQRLRFSLRRRAEAMGHPRGLGESVSLRGHAPHDCSTAALESSRGLAANEDAPDGGSGQKTATWRDVEPGDAFAQAVAGIPGIRVGVDLDEGQGDNGGGDEDDGGSGSGGGSTSGGAASGGDRFTADVGAEGGDDASDVLDSRCRGPADSLMNESGGDGRRGVVRRYDEVDSHGEGFPMETQRLRHDEFQGLGMAPRGHP